MILKGGNRLPFFILFAPLFYGRFGGDRLRHRGDPAPHPIVPIVYRHPSPHLPVWWTV